MVLSHLNKMRFEFRWNLNAPIDFLRHNRNWSWLTFYSGLFVTMGRIHNAEYIQRTVCTTKIMSNEKYTTTERIHNKKGHWTIKTNHIESIFWWDKFNTKVRISEFSSAKKNLLNNINSWYILSVCNKCVIVTKFVVGSFCCILFKSCKQSSVGIPMP